MTNAVEQGIAIIEEFRTTMRDLGKSSPAVEKFADEVILLTIVSGSPKAAVEAAMRNLCSKPTGVRA
ncbi:hypothetical protein PV377_10950 [Streptomyces ipomoeae]|uniref:hypothetical protein n=1 Tax=Streptomyces ipomoeae TaxID=103232 RepID=UPI0029ADDFE4|nr:hypothetical protein [Streptomyces ipomoeae]MDX2839489.1 hypothetical protein [Streptomyces ipomoeae]